MPNEPSRLANSHFVPPRPEAAHRSAKGKGPASPTLSGEGAEVEADRLEPPAKSRTASEASLQAPKPAPAAPASPPAQRASSSSSSKSAAAAQPTESPKVRVSQPGPKGSITRGDWQQNVNGLTVIGVDYHREGKPTLHLEVALTQSFHLDRAAHEGADAAAVSRSEALDGLLLNLVQYSLAQAQQHRQADGWRTEFCLGPNGTMQYASLYPPGVSKAEGGRINLINTSNPSELAPGKVALTNNQWLDQLCLQLQHRVHGEAMATVSGPSEAPIDDQARHAKKLAEARREEERHQMRQDASTSALA